MSFTPSQYWVNQLEETLAGRAEVTTRVADIRPALEDSLIVVWVLPPHLITLETSTVDTYEGQIVVLGPATGDQLEEYTSIAEIARDCAVLTEAPQVRFDSVQLGNSPFFPAAEITYTTTLER